MESIAIDSPLTRFQRVMYGALTVGGQYAWTRLNRLVAAQGWGDLAEVRILSIVIGLHGLMVYPDVSFYMNLCR